MVALAALVGALSLAASVADAFKFGRFVLGGNNVLTASRMDPIVFPGQVGGHVHLVYGGSKFRSVLNTPEEQMKSKCSSTKLSADMSNYWVPQVYFINANGTYSPILGVSRLYYAIGGEPEGVQMQPFPKGLRMISGNAMYRDEGDIRSHGVQISLNRDPNTNDKYWPRQSPSAAPHQTIMSINFPRCGWANQSLDSPDHFSHMTWPRVPGDFWGWMETECPESHPILYPQLLIEVVYDLSPEMRAQWRTDQPNFILANGDVTGVTYHGDFVNGWDEQVLMDAMQQECGGVEDDIERCVPFRPFYQGDDRYECRIEGAIPDEDTGYYRPISKLPGCNPRWDWDGPLAKPKDCPAEDPPAWAAPKLQITTMPLGNSRGMPIALPGVDVGPHPENLTSSIGWKAFDNVVETKVTYQLWSRHFNGSEIDWVLHKEPDATMLFGGKWDQTTPIGPVYQNGQASTKNGMLYPNPWCHAKNPQLPCGTFHNRTGAAQPPSASTQAVSDSVSSASSATSGSATGSSASVSASSGSATGSASASSGSATGSATGSASASDETASGLGGAVGLHALPQTTESAQPAILFGADKRPPQVLAASDAPNSTIVSSVSSTQTPAATSGSGKKKCRSKKHRRRTHRSNKF